MRKFWISKLILAVLVLALASTPGHASPLFQPLCAYALQLDILGRYNSRGEININEVPVRTLARVPEFSAVTQHWLFQKMIDRGNNRGLYPIFFVMNGTDPTQHFRTIYETLQHYFRNGPEMLASDLSGRDAHGAIVVRPASIQDSRIKIKSSKRKEEFLAFRQSDPILYISLYATLGKTQDYDVLVEATLGTLMQHPLLPDTYRRTYIVPVILNTAMGGDSPLLRNRWQPRYEHSITHLLGVILMHTLIPKEFMELVFLHAYYRDQDHWVELKKLVSAVFAGDMDALDNPMTFFVSLIQIAASVSKSEAKIIFEELGFPKIQGFIDHVLLLE